MTRDRPIVHVFGGPNGAGKSTIAPKILATCGGTIEFVNADVIARGLAGTDSSRTAFAAGRIMLRRLRELADDHISFAFESTLSSRSFAPFIRQLRREGFSVQLHYVWVRSAQLAIRRVALRYATGGHFIPHETVRRRYRRSMVNCLDLYLPLMDAWWMYDNSNSPLVPVACSSTNNTPVILQPTIWRRFGKLAHDFRSQLEHENE